jgi:hypothetical protein
VDKEETSYGGFDNLKSVELPEKVAFLSPNVQCPEIKGPSFYVTLATARLDVEAIMKPPGPPHEIIYYSI